MKMPSRTALWTIGIGLFVLGTLASAPVQAANEGAADLVQVGTYDYLTQPDFTPLAEVREIAEGHTLGLGTFTNLDGELVMVGGSVYQVGTDGTPREVSEFAGTPFMQAIRFRPQTNAPVPPGTTCAQLPALITEVAQQSNGIVAVRVRGTFTDLVTRSVTADLPPFQPLSQTVAEQTVFPLGQQRAVLVGFWQGRDALGIGQDGLHLHGLNADRSAGGHVLSCEAGADVQLSVQSVSSVRVRTP